MSYNDTPLPPGSSAPDHCTVKLGGLLAGSAATTLVGAVVSVALLAAT